MFKKLFRYIFIVILLLGSNLVWANLDGAIDSSNNSALLCTNDACTTNTRINFLTTNGEPVQVSDNYLIGEIWSEKMGWIKLDPTNSGVINDGTGNLSGYAWGENTGWINFAPTHGGVRIIGDTGEFSGWAWAQNAGWIKFDCAVTNACVQTSWRVRTNSSGSVSSNYKNIYITPTETIPENSSTEKVISDFQQVLTTDNNQNFLENNFLMPLIYPSIVLLEKANQLTEKFDNLSLPAENNFLFTFMISLGNYVLSSVNYILTLYFNGISFMANAVSFFSLL